MQKLPTLVLSVLVALLLASPAAAQDVPRAPETQAWIASVIAIVLIIAVATASFMSSRRTHQD